MADVFISYSKADRPLALKLATMLEAEGWKAWWDTSLIPGDDFRHEIMTELGRARAVIVIWTDASIKSDWVRSEAGRAQADRKLIPVKLGHLTYKDLPPPFDVLHTENVGEEDKIKAAVVAQLAKPAAEPTAWALLGKGFKYEVLTWVGIVGGALTLFTNLGAVLKLADWARILVEHWREWTHAFWVWVFGWLGIHLPPQWAPVLSFLLFGSLLTIGQAFQFNRMIKNQSIDEKRKSYDSVENPLVRLTRGSSQLSWGLGRRVLMILGFMLLPISLALLSIASNNLLTRLALRILPSSILETGMPYLERYGFVPLIILFMLISIRYELHAVLATCLMIIFWMIITTSQFIAIPSSNGFVSLTAVAMIAILPQILLSFAPARAISRRFIFMALGLILLIALNELSKLGLDLTAPKLQG